MRNLHFSKMHGAGNDFVVIDATRDGVELDAAQIQFLCDRHLGIGADQLLLVQASLRPDCDFHYRIFNCDGQEVEQCGNGARCFAKFVQQKQLTSKRRIRVHTIKGVIEPELLPDGRVRVDMGAPNFLWSQFPFLTQGLEKRCVNQSEQFALSVSAANVWASPVSMGNPCATVFVDHLDGYDVASIGSALGTHRAFPSGANIAFLQVIDRKSAKIRVYERGAGETLACGTGTCAAVVAAIQSGLCDHAVEVDARGGSLLIEWDGNKNSSVFLTGPAKHVFDGEITLEG